MKTQSVNNVTASLFAGTSESFLFVGAETYFFILNESESFSIVGNRVAFF